MKAGLISVEAKVDELLVVLEMDIENIQQSLSLLNELRSFVVKRDDAALGKLLGVIRTKSDDYSTNELKRQRIRKELAVVMGCGVQAVTLSRLEGVLSGEKVIEIAEKKAKLKSLLKELKREYMATAMLLSDCARFNRVLLENVFEIGKTGIATYSSDGSTKRQTDTSFVSLRF